MSSTNLVTVRFTEEVTYGVAPTSTQTLARMTGESFKQDTGTVSSAEIVADRQIPSVVRSSVGASGDLNWEMYLGGSLTTLMQGALQSASVVAESGGAISMKVDADDGTGSGHFFAASGTPFSSFAAGEWVKTTRFGDTANNSFFRVKALVGTGIGIIVDQPGTLVDDLSGFDADSTCTQGAYFDNGTTQKSYTFEKEFTDLASTFEHFKGATCDGMSLTVPTDGVLTGSFSYTGKECVSATASLNALTDTAAGTGAVLSGIDNVAVFYENDVALTITGFSMQLTNNLRGRQEVGSAFATSIGSGSLGISGSFQAYFAAGTPVDVVDRYLNGTDTNIAIAMEKGLVGLVIDLPRVRLTSGTRVAGGQNQDIIIEVGFEAFKHETLGHTVRVTTW